MMKKRIFAVVAVVVAVMVTLNIGFLSLMLNVLVREPKEKQHRVYYNNVYYASADENTGSLNSSSLHKGGAVYVGDDSTYTVTDADLIGNSNIYGGAVYVASGGIFTMTGGKIEGNAATYGGAIYIQNGGTCRLENVEIIGNMADNAPAIYVENGGILEVTGTTNIEGNFFTIHGYKISQDVVRVGHLTNGIDMHYLEYGTYPQTYVGNAMNETLESWFQAEQPTAVREFCINDFRNSFGYMYTDGNCYARVSSFPLSEYTYSTGETVVAKYDMAWFKVEPIKWIILNYDKIINGTAENIEIMSYEALSSYLDFNTSQEADGVLWVNSFIRTWLNMNFYFDAFSENERQFIELTTVLNSVPKDVTSSDSDGKGVTTNDYIYLMSVYEITEKLPPIEYRLCSPTDFVVSNGSWVITDANNPTKTRPNGGTIYWWTRSPGIVGDIYVARVEVDGVIGDAAPYSNNHYAIRPRLNLKIK